MKETTIKLKRKQRRVKRIRSKILAKSNMPRLTVFRSNKHIYAQIIDDKKGTTVASVNEKEIDNSKLNKTQKAEEVGRAIAKKALGKKIKKIVFDKGPYRYHGRVKALADGARSEGLVF